MKSFKGKVAAITGAGSGIGRALALQLAREGAALALSDVNSEGLAETARLAGALGARVSQTKVDVSRREQMQDWAAQVVAEHGGCHLIFNNAGVAHAGLIQDVKIEDFEWIMGINFWGVVYGTQFFLPHLKASGDGHVVNISSLFGLIAVPGNGTYNASKFAVRGYTEALAQEMALQKWPVGVTSVHPGGIKTNIARSARMDASMVGVLVKDTDQGRRDFEKLFRTTAEEAARVILDGVRKGRRRVLIGADAKAIDVLARVLPEGYQSLVGKVTRQMRGR
ncbi:MAG TPA: SDR family NAD(P)-dependent oxidoreductase [Nevskiaceae bacterium]|nr:SDR family NAD(P)-dependent oxidoreductase [Nevskiaceae bacterium]